MKIFLSYANEQRRLAEELAARLEREHHEVFYDRDDIRPGGAFDRTIEDAIRAADLFIFLLSPHSVAAGRYTLSELRAAKETGRGKRDFVWGVQVETTPKGDVPPFLKGGSLFFPQGDVVAEILQEVRRRHEGVIARRRRVWAAAGLATVLGTGVVIYRITGAPSPPALQAAVSDAASPDLLPAAPDALASKPDSRPQLDARATRSGKSPSGRPASSARTPGPGPCTFDPELHRGRWFLVCTCKGEVMHRHPLTDIADDRSTVESLRRPAKELAAQVHWSCP